MRGEIAKQFSPVINHPVAVSIKCQPRIIGIWSSPRDLFFISIGIEVKTNSIGGIGQIVTVASDVNHNRGKTFSFLSCGKTVTTGKLFSLIRG